MTDPDTQALPPQADPQAYAIGTPGQHPRFVIVTPYPADAQAQAEAGEAVFVVATIPPEPYAISDDGTTLVSVPVPLKEMQDALWQLAKGYRDQWIAMGVNTDYGVVKTDAPSLALLAIGFAAAEAAAADPNAATPAIAVPLEPDIVGSILDLDKQRALALKINGRIYPGLFAAEAIRQDIYRAADATDLAAIDITAGYPRS